MFARISIFEFPAKWLYPQTRITDFVTYLLSNSNNISTFQINVYLFCFYFQKKRFDE